MARSAGQQRRHDRTAAEIRRHAAELLAEQGETGLTLRAVADRMDRSAGSLYGYYGSRDELLGAVLGDFYLDALRAMQAAANGAGRAPRARVAALAGAYRRWALDHRREFRLMLDRGADAAVRPPVAGREPGSRLRFVTTLLDEAGPLLAADRHPTPPPSAAPELAHYRAVLAAMAPRSDEPTDGALFAALAAWTDLHGYVVLEVLGHLPFYRADPEEMFGVALATALDRLDPAGGRH
ncbi:TetR/AcrR family transcriptional regulator [Micromonospora sp. NPDC000089]|uniref:TetR/AcrR family transcriptional regulator n=1 Tax=unclassified Micromonospora TaxID=2617518 RepID=UPI0036A53989